ncbi:MAG: hypothetical protein QOC55_2312 [Thermoleophilaceae bacterium]|jgi:hypothetical protein|nr:hypothetical protein [Frankiaceae bacterium]MDQ1714457.1 hypothetical protein [Frankiaceae bacterium]MEA2484365.1 hypothetical protein [Thermoleophilaceae bacterium]
MDAQVRAWLDQQDSLVADNIRRHGWHIEFVFGEEEDDETSFAYTVGMFGLGHPELLIFGVSPHTAAGVLNELGDRICSGGDLLAGTVLTLHAGSRRVVPEVVPNPGDIVFTANRHFRRADEASVPVLQLTWDDHKGLFPWEAGYSLPDWLQPRPGTFSA